MQTANKRIVVAWLVLTAITAAYLWIDRSAGSSDVATASTVVTVLAICIALLKARIIMRQFMEVRHSPPLLARVTDLWIAVVAAALLITYFAGKAVS